MTEDPGHLLPVEDWVNVTKEAARIRKMQESHEESVQEEAYELEGGEENGN